MISVLVLKSGEISIIIDGDGLNLLPQISYPVCLPVPKSFNAMQGSADTEIDVVVVGRGVGYEQFAQLSTSFKIKFYSTCYTNEGMLRNKDAALANEQHLFIPCKNYYRFEKNKPNNDVCILKEKARVNGNTLNIKTKQYII